MKVGFIGAGKVGTTLGMYLKDNKIPIKGYYSKTYESACNSATRTSSNAYKNIDDLIVGLDIVFVTTNDDGIEIIDKMLAASQKLNPKCVIIHTSGAHSSDIFEALKEKDMALASMHPLQAFANIDDALVAIKETLFTIEGDRLALEVVMDLLGKVGNRYFVINKEQKPLYHGAACIMSNYLVTLMDYGLKFFEASGLNRDEIFEAVLPLIEGTLKNIRANGTVDALTGPLVRGDKKTIESHIITGEQLIPHEMDLYKVLAEKTLDMVSETRMNSNQVNEMKDLIRSVRND